MHIAKRMNQALRLSANRREYVAIAVSDTCYAKTCRKIQVASAINIPYITIARSLPNNRININSSLFATSSAPARSPSMRSLIWSRAVRTITGVRSGFDFDPPRD